MRKCNSKYAFVLRKGNCQGIAKHKGHHWYYDSDGTLIQWRNNNDEKSKYAGGKSYGGFGASWTPPDHKHWIHPKSKIKHTFKWAKRNLERKKEKKKK